MFRKHMKALAQVGNSEAQQWLGGEEDVVGVIGSEARSNDGGNSVLQGKGKIENDWSLFFETREYLAPVGSLTQLTGTTTFSWAAPTGSRFVLIPLAISNPKSPTG